jgi:peptide/nickel transport system ATP-binding protein
VQPIFQNPFEAFSRYRTIDSYLYETATRVARLGKTDAIAAMEEALSVVGLDYKDVRGKYPNQFSGGELQRASVARALIPHPSLIIADEPVSMIDASRRLLIINLFMALKQEYKTSFLYITHDLATAYYISDYTAVMNRGTVVEFGEAHQVLQNPQHEYTRLLLSSIPALDHKWSDELVVG